MNKTMNKKLLFLLWLFVLGFSSFPQNHLPQIPELKSKNEVFKEYSYIVADNYKLLAAGKEPEMIFFTYKVADENLTLFALASRCNIPYDTIATLNRISHISEKLDGRTIILPTAPGLFISEASSKNSLEILLQENYFNSSLTNKCIYYNIGDERFAFLPGLRFSPTERYFFLDAEMRLPLDKDSYWISSVFGKRKNPFSGEMKLHKGVDLAAKEGTAVYAIKDGDIAFCINNDSTFGNYIIISHDRGSMTSVYAHLSEISVQKYQSVKKGDIIGYVGSTGMATGPHLHFEIRQGGEALNPEDKLKLKQ